MFKTENFLNYIYEPNGNIVTGMKEVKNNSFLFLKRDPGFNFTEREINLVMVSQLLLFNYDFRGCWTVIKDRGLSHKAI